MARVYFTLKMVIDLLAFMIMISSMAKAYITSRVEVDMKANGKKASTMVRALCFAAMVM